VKQARVLFVCLGNICRSPTAEGVFRHIVTGSGLKDDVHIDSAGTSDWHIGRPPDSRTIDAARSRGYDLSCLRGRQVTAKDFAKFDFVLAMDRANLDELERIRPRSFAGHLGLFLAFGSQSTYTEVPDPYHGGARGFDLVLDLVEDACSGLVDHLKNTQ